LRTGSRLATFPKLRPGGGKGKEKATTAEAPGHSDEVLTLALSDDGRYLASAGKDRRVGVWDAEKGEWVRGLGGHRDTISVRVPSRPTSAVLSCVIPFYGLVYSVPEGNAAIIHGVLRPHDKII